jgi:tetratricopeptide (TPR) repeat protein
LYARVSEAAAAAHNRAIELRKAERFDEALEEIELSLRLGAKWPETLVMRAHLLADLGRHDEAVDQYRRVLAMAPAQIDAHETYARLLPQLGQGAEAMDTYRAALVQAPDIGMLWVSAMATAKAIGNWPHLLEIARAALVRFGRDTMISVFEAHALSGLGDDSAAQTLLREATDLEPGYAPAQTTLAHVLIRLGEYRAAESPALQATRLAPHDQSAWSLLTVIWRLMEDPREHWLADYDRLVVPVHVEGINWTTLAASLTARHRTLQHPAEQSLRGGTQTRGTLFDSPDAEIATLQTAIRVAVRSAVARLPDDPSHPFLSRNSDAIDFAGSWSVRLRSQGFHINHMHPQGWMSSALYVSLPAGLGESDAGALAFGMPDAALKLNLLPRRIVRPAQGRLVVFPSYLWHGTIPFESEEVRLTVAFDALPSASGDGGPIHQPGV